MWERFLQLFLIVMDKKDQPILQCTDIFGSQVVFEKNNFEKHKAKHRELEDSSFCPRRILKALQKPTLTIKSKIDGYLCYYYQEYSNNGIMMYTKVVVDERFRLRKKLPVCFVKTAFRIDHVQELKYDFKPNYHK